MQEPQNDFFGSLGVNLSNEERAQLGKQAYSIIERKTFERLMAELKPEDAEELANITDKQDGKEKDEKLQAFLMLRQELLGKLFMQEAEKYRKELEVLVSDIPD